MAVKKTLQSPIIANYKDCQNFALIEKQKPSVECLLKQMMSKTGLCQETSACQIKITSRAPHLTICNSTSAHDKCEGVEIGI